MEKFTIAVLVHNRFGVLNRVTSMYRRRRFNIRALFVSEAASTEYSQIVLTFEGDVQAKEQLVNQLYKLIDVCAIKELDACELPAMPIISFD